MKMQYSELKSLIVQTMKAKDEKKLLALRSLDSSVKNVAISNGRKDPTEEDLVVAIRKSVSSNYIENIAIYTHQHTFIP